MPTLSPDASAGFSFTAAALPFTGTLKTSYWLAAVALRYTTRVPSGDSSQSAELLKPLARISGGPGTSDTTYSL